MNGAALRVGRPLTMRLLRRVLLFSAVVLVLFAGARAWWEYHTTLAAVHEEFEVIESTKARSVAASLWDLDREQLALHMEGIRHFQYITYAGVRDASGVVAQSGVRRDKGVLDREFPLFTVYNGQRQDLGVLHVQADLLDLHSKAWRIARLVLAVNATLVLLMAGLMFWLTNNMISRHLATFAAFLGSYSLGGENRPLTLDKKPAGDELDVLANALNTMQEGLATSYAQVLAAQAEARSLARFPQENPSPVLRAGADGVLLTANPSSASLLAHLGVHVGQKLPEAYASIVAQALARGGEQRFEIAFGQRFFVFSASPVPAEGFVNIYGLDITERKQAEEQLRGSEARIRALFDATSDAAILMDTGGVILAINEHGAKRRGLAPEDMLGQPITRHLPPEAAASRMLQIQEAVRTRGPRAFEENREGSIYAITIYPILDAEGVPRQLASFSRDITRQKESERIILLNNARLQCLVRVLQHKAESVQEFLDFSLSEALALTGSRLGCIHHYSEERREFVLKSWSGEILRERAVKGGLQACPLDKAGLWGEAVRQRGPVIVNDSQAASPLGLGCPEGPVELSNFMTVPVFQGDRIMAVAGVGNRHGGYQDADVQQFSLLMDACWQVVGRLDAEHDVRRSLHEKEILLKEIHHRVKNNLQIISSLLFLQAEYVIEPQDRAMFEESQKRISAMALVHEELYGSDDLASVGMGEYVPRLVERVVASSDASVQLAFDVEDMRLPVTRSIPCGLVLNEMVMNAVKHAFRSAREGRLRVSLRQSDGQIELAVEDNGPGLPQDFDLESPSTLGLTLITSLAHQLGGSVTAQSLEAGARFTLRFPAEEQ
jgi:PAS domain S-box-containing protein